MTKKEIQELINNSLYATLGFIDETGNPGVRKVFCTWHKGIGTHLISTNTSSMHVQCLLNNSKACLYFDDPEKVIGICLTGTVNVHFDSYYKKLIWKEGDEIFYPHGVEDDDYCVIEFTAEKGRYYRSDGIGSILPDEIKEHDKNRQLTDYYNILSK